MHPCFRPNADYRELGRLGGQATFGETKGSSKATEEAILWARREKAKGTPWFAIAKSIGLSVSATRQAVTGITWKHLK